LGRSCGETLLETDQVAVGILNDELANAYIGVVPPIPALFER
jgi:hypothetical protein